MRSIQLRGQGMRRDLDEADSGGNLGRDNDQGGAPHLSEDQGRPGPDPEAG